MNIAMLKTKYAFHLLAWWIQPEVVLDIGSMDGADSRRFRQLLPNSHIVAFEGNPDNYRAMLGDLRLARDRVRVLNALVADQEGERSFYIQRSAAGDRPDNRGTSSVTPRTVTGMKMEEIRVGTVRADLFLRREFPDATGVAAWIDVEGHAFAVLDGMRGECGRINLVHVEVETEELWPGQKLEKEVLVLAKDLGMVAIARGANETQRDAILVNEAWLAKNRLAVATLLRLARICGPLLSGIIRYAVRIRTYMFQKKKRV